MMGCHHGAKNSLDKNYLYFAEKHGCRIYPETKVVDVTPLNGKEDGSDGYRVRTVKSTALFNKQPRIWTAGGIVFAASALGTMDLMFRVKQRGSLPRLSDTLGTRVRTNAESLIGVRVPRTKDDLSKGVAIGSGIYLDEHTHIEATRYPAGSDSMGLLGTVMARGSGFHRILIWFFGLIGSLIRHPWRTVRILHPFGFAKECMILLCMQALEGHIEMKLGRPWYWPFRKVLISRGGKIPTNIPQANDFAQKLAEVSGGTAMSMLNEILFDIPGTAHIMGGCPMGRSAEDGVVDHACRVFNYRNMFACDGSILSANLGVNPSLTITALSERAMSLVPEAEALSPQGK
jgi:cholesterol oxidase